MQSHRNWRGHDDVMQTRSFRGSGEPARVNASSNARFGLGPDPRRALGPAAMRAASTGRTHDRTRPMLHQRKKALVNQAPSTHDPQLATITRATKGFSTRATANRVPGRLDYNFVNLTQAAAEARERRRPFSPEHRFRKSAVNIHANYASHVCSSFSKAGAVAQDRRTGA